MLQRNSIQKLEKNVADKIAAGEVVTRPLSIIKEILENAIDAGATSVTVEIRDGGKSYIRVTDDGCGIPAEELPLAFERHATSKIRRAEDLSNILSLGFRGEALASIAAVTRVEVITKTADEKVGARIRLEGGEITEQGPTGCPDGTTIIVRDLFYNTPARQKFLKPSGTESSLIIDFVSKLSLAYPEIRMRLINNGSALFSTTGKGSRFDNVLTIYSREIGDSLLKAPGKNGDYEMEAYVSPPDRSRANRKHQVFFVNGRAVKSKVLEEGLNRAYWQRLEKDRQPVAFLFLKVDPGRLDVNIHPNKQEIRFDNNEEIILFVAETISKAISTIEGVRSIRSDNLFQMTAPALDTDFKHKQEKEIRLQRAGENETKAGAEQQVDIIKLLSSKRAEQEKEKEKENKPIKSNSEPSFDLIQEETSSYSIWENLKITGSIFDTYITAADETHFYLFDQHAAHERIFYEKLLSAYDTGEKEIQILMTPVIKEVVPSVASRFAEWIEPLWSMGFDVSLFGARSFIIKGIPAFMNQSEAQEFLDRFLDQADTMKHKEDPATLKKIVMQACKSAVKANQRLSEREREQLIRDLAAAKQPFSCPHGRPTFIKLSKNEIEKMFLRV